MGIARPSGCAAPGGSSYRVTDSRSVSACALARRTHRSDPLGDRDCLSERVDVQLLHDALPMRLYGALRGAEIEGNLLVEPAANHKLENLTFARRETGDQRPQCL